MDCHISELEIENDTIRLVLLSGGDEIQIVPDIEITGRYARLFGCHFLGAGPNTLGLARLRELARWMKGMLDVDELRIEGATRTSGAGPGLVPPPCLLMTRSSLCCIGSAHSTGAFPSRAAWSPRA